jgi:predicted nuclease with TOPRIM domain
MLFLLPIVGAAEDVEQSKWKKGEWYQHFDDRLNKLEEQLSADIEEVHKNQELLNKEMIRLNEKLESRFDKYFLWGYGTLLVVISSVTNLIFLRKKKEENAEEKPKTVMG